jgi:hypothetical protein
MYQVAFATAPSKLLDLGDAEVSSRAGRDHARRSMMVLEVI